MTLVFRRAGMLCLLLLAAPPAFANPGPFVPGAPQTFSTRSTPRSVTTGDLNNDGIPDMVVSASGGISIHLGLGNGAFAPKVDEGASAPLGNVVLGDFNGDGKLDMAAPFRHAVVPGIVVWAGNGDGTFGPINLYSGPANADYIVKADFNHDGKMDLAICGYATTAGTASVYLTGTPAIPGGVPNFARTDYAVGNRPQGITAGYVKTSETFPDLVTANTTAGTLTILKNDGAGHFGNRQDITAKLGVWAVTIGRVEGGWSRPQIAAVNKDSSSVSLIKTDDGTTFFRNEFPTAAGPRDVIIADADGDGFNEVVVAATAGNVISILGYNWNGNGTGAQTLLPKNDIAAGTSPTSVTVVNFNGDLKNDLLTTNSVGATVTWIPSAPSGIGWNYGDTMPDDWSAPNQFGAQTNFAGLRTGKWILLDLCSTWCSPCRDMAEHTQDLYLRWAGNPNLQFEYVTALADGRTPGIPSTVNDALAWGHTFHINRPILHSGGSLSGGARNLAIISGLVVTPTLRLIDPQGRVRWYHEGAADDSTICRVLANAAGVAIPPPPAAGIDVGIANGTMVVSHGNQAAQQVYDENSGTFPFYQNGLAFDDNLIGWPKVTRDASGLETWQLTLRYNEVGLSGIAYEPLPTDDYWRLTLSNLALDVLNRIPADGGMATVTVKDTTNNANTQYYEVQALIPYTWSNAGTFNMDPIPADKLAELPLIREVTVMWTLQIGNIVTGVSGGGGAHLALRAPFPNPAVGESRLEWSQPRAGLAKLELYDVRGRLVKTLANGVLPAGDHGARWDLTDDNGARVGAGLYFARVKVEGFEAAATRITVLR